MDPFALQQAARKRTSRLVALAVAAVAATVVATGFVALLACWVLWVFFGSRGETSYRYCISSGEVEASSMSYPMPGGLPDFCSRYPAVPVLCFALSLAFILVRWAFRYFSLSSGDAVMKELGAKRLFRRTLALGDTDGSRLRFFNVCEEMSIASGLDMPSVWILEDVPNVNALAAGTDPSAAAVCVTRGAVANLTRDELQGVVAHEFSHILNGDMRLNMRITAIIAGITSVARLGRGMLGVFKSRSSADGSEGRIRLPRVRGKGGGAVGVVILVYCATAALLWLVGSVGAFFARLVQCAVSREREFLADASAAQFTRNPEALAGAIRFASLAEAVRGGGAFEAWKDEVSHMLFSGGAERLLATHPPVEDRIRRLCPRGLADEGAIKSRVKAVVEQRRERGKAYERKLVEDAARLKALRASVVPLADTKVQPAALMTVRSAAKAGEALVGLVRGRAPDGWTGPLTAADRRTLALRCVNTLRDGATQAERRRWAAEAESAVREDGAYDSFEMMVMASVRRRLLSDGSDPGVVPGGQLRNEAARVVATVASFGSNPAGGYAEAWRRISLLGPGVPPKPAPFDDAEDFLSALDRLRRLSPLAKRELLVGLKAAIDEDGKVTDEEANYLAAAADAIGAYGWAQIKVGPGDI